MLKGEVDVRVVFDSEEEARAVYEAIEPELSSSSSDRAQVNAAREGEKISIAFLGFDSPSLRASINSYMRWMMTGSSIIAIERSD